MVENGELVLEDVRRRKPDIILLDTIMPVMDGYDAAKQLIQESSLDGVPTIAFITQAPGAIIVKALRAGRDVCLMKPVRRAEFLEKIVLWLSRNPGDWMPERQGKREAMS